MFRPLPTIVAILLTFTGCSLSGPGADSTAALEEGLREAIESGDLAAAQRFFLDGELFIKSCPDRFQTESREGFLRKVANGKRRFAHYFEECRTRVSGSFEGGRRRGGEKLRQASGCSEQVWEYGDIKVDASSGGRPVTLSIEGLMGIGGRYFVVERVRCR